MLGAFAHRHGDRRRPRARSASGSPSASGSSASPPPWSGSCSSRLADRSRDGGSARAREQRLGEPQVERRRHLEVLGLGRVDQDPAAGGLDQHRLVGRPPRPSRDRPPAPRAAPRPGTPAASAPPRAGRDRGSPRRRVVHLTSLWELNAARSARGDPLDRVGDRGRRRSRRRPRGRPRGSRRRPRSAPAVSSGRAASWIATSSVSTASRALATDARAGLAAGEDPDARRRLRRVGAVRLDRRRLVGVPRRAGDDDRRDAGRPEGLDRPLDHRPPGERHEGLRAAGSEPLSGAGGRDDRGDGRCAISRTRC